MSSDGRARFVQRIRPAVALGLAFVLGLMGAWLSGWIPIPVTSTPATAVERLPGSISAQVGGAGGIPTPSMDVDPGAPLPAENLTSGLVRFRVVAHSDEAWDQQVKVRVRDRLLPELETIAARHGGWVGTPWELYLERLSDVARAQLVAMDVSYGAHAALVREPFPTLKITLGDGLGENWWCVLFPPLCFVDGASTSSFVEEVREERGTTGPDADRLRVGLWMLRGGSVARHEGTSVVDTAREDLNVERDDHHLDEASDERKLWSRLWLTE